MGYRKQNHDTWVCVSKKFLCVFDYVNTDNSNNTDNDEDVNEDANGKDYDIENDNSKLDMPPYRITSSNENERIFLLCYFLFLFL